LDDLLDFEYEVTLPSQYIIPPANTGIRHMHTQRQHSGGFERLFPTDDKQQNAHYYSLFDATPADVALATYIANNAL